MFVGSSAAVVPGSIREILDPDGTATPTFRTIVADPPWDQKAGPLRAGVGEGFVFDGAQVSQDLAYPTMGLEEIKALPVADIAQQDCHLYLWTTNKYLPAAFDVLKAWGFRYSTTIVWAKNLMGSGLGGTWRVSTEFVVFGYRGKVGKHGSVAGTWHNWKRPYDERGKPKGSAKPPEFAEAVEKASPGPYIELFARERRDGWSAWGNEVASDVRLIPTETHPQQSGGTA